jgi:LysM repeat protein
MAELERAFLKTETGTQIDCMFNPETFSFTTTNSWKPDDVAGKAPRQNFQGGEPGSFDLDLIFDTTHDGTSVTTHTNQLLALMAIDPDLVDNSDDGGPARPPWVTFHWGQHIATFPAVITNLTVSFTYFSNEGMPLRASVSASLTQYEEDPTWTRQNPTSGTPKPHRTHLVGPGDSLDRLAAKYYGDSTQWRVIADANAIADPLGVRAGTIIKVPQRPTDGAT